MTKYVSGVFALLLLAGGLRAAAPRVALVATSRSETVRNVLDLTEAELSGDKDVDLLNRSTIDRVLAEHELSLAGLVNANTVVSAGKLLAVDLFAVLETDPSGKEALGLVVFDAASGIRLWDAALPGDDIKQTAVRAAGDVRAAIKKQAAGLKKLQTVCLLGVRNADLPPVMNSFGQFVALLLERRLLASDSVAVLERQRLDLVNRERTLPANAAEKELLASVILIELEIRRGPKGEGLRAVAFLSDGKGKALHQVSADAAEARAADLAGPLVRDITEYLRVNAAPAAAGEKAEGSSFLREAQLMWSHQQLLQGLQAAESAGALAPDSPENQAVLAQYLLSYAVYLVDPRGMTSITYGRGGPLHKVETATLKASLDLARRGVETRLTVFERLRPWDRRSLVRDFGRNLSTQAGLRSYVNKLLYIDPASYDSETEELLHSFRKAVDRLLTTELEGWAEVAAGSPVQKSELSGPTPPNSALSQYEWEIKGRLELIIWNSPDAAAFTRTLGKIMQRWLEVSAQVDVNQYQTWHLTWFLQETTGKLIAPFGATWDMTPEDLGKVLPIFEGMERHPHPLIALYGRTGQLLIGLRLRQLTPAEARGKVLEVCRRALDLIRQPPVEPAADFRVGCYKFLAYALGQVDMEIVNVLRLHIKNDPALWQQEVAPLADEFYTVCDFMLERQELVPDVLTAALDYGGGTLEYARKKMALIDRAEAVAASPECRLFDGPREGFQGKMRTQRDQLLARHPELAPKTEANAGLPWEQVQTLLDVGKLTGIQTFTAATVHKEDVYVVGGRSEGAECLLQLIRVSLSGGEPQLLGKAKIGLAANLIPSSLHMTVTACRIEGRHAYIATKSDGILVFDLDGGATRRLGTEQGLPANAVTALDLLDGKLYATLEGGYLVAVDPDTAKVEVIASSRRKEKLSPFDDNPMPFNVPCLVADAERHRLLFVLYQGTPSTANTTDGLWEYQAETQKFSQRLRFARNGTVHWNSRIHDGQVLFSSPWFALAYDLGKDRATLIGNSPNPFPPGTKPDVRVAFTSAPPHLLRDGWLWVSYPFGRVSLDSGRLETFPTFASNANLNGFAAAVLEPVGRGDRLLVGTHTALYLATLRSDASGEKDRKKP